MFGFRYFNARPTVYVMQLRDGRVRREGTGLSFFYFAPATSIVSMPVSSQAHDFIHSLTTADFQTVTLQGQVVWRIGAPKKAAALVDFTLRPDGKGYASDEPQKLAERVGSRVEILAQKAIQQRNLREALLAADAVAADVARELAAASDLQALGLEIVGFVVTAIRPTPEAARALEAEAREAILRAADDAIFARRNAAVANERAIRESELDTEVAVEQKKRQVRDAQMDAEQSVARKKAELRQASMESDITLEGSRTRFVELNAGNTRALAEAEAHKIASIMTALQGADPRIVQAVAAAGMAPGQLIAQAFGGIAERAERIGQLNLSPDLLDSLMRTPAPYPAARPQPVLDATADVPAVAHEAREAHDAGRRATPRSTEAPTGRRGK